MTEGAIPKIPKIVSICIETLNSLEWYKYDDLKKNLGPIIDNDRLNQLSDFDFEYFTLEYVKRWPAEHLVALIFHFYGLKKHGSSFLPEHVYPFVEEASSGTCTLDEVLFIRLSPEQRLAIFRLWLIVTGATDQANWVHIYRILDDLLGPSLKLLLTLMNYEYRIVEDFRKLLVSDIYAREDEPTRMLLNWVERVKGTHLVFYGELEEEKTTGKMPRPVEYKEPEFLDRDAQEKNAAIGNNNQKFQIKNDPDPAPEKLKKPLASLIKNDLDPARKPEPLPSSEEQPAIKNESDSGRERKPLPLIKNGAGPATGIKPTSLIRIKPRPAKEIKPTSLMKLLRRKLFRKPSKTLDIFGVLGVPIIWIDGIEMPYIFAILIKILPELKEDEVENLFRFLWDAICDRKWVGFDFRSTTLARSAEKSSPAVLVAMITNLYKIELLGTSLVPDSAMFSMQKVSEGNMSFHEMWTTEFSQQQQVAMGRLWFVCTELLYVNMTKEHIGHLIELWGKRLVMMMVLLIIHGDEHSGTRKSTGTQFWGKDDRILKKWARTQRNRRNLPKKQLKYDIVVKFISAYREPIRVTRREIEAPPPENIVLPTNTSPTRERLAPPKKIGSTSRLKKYSNSKQVVSSKEKMSKSIQKFVKRVNTVAIFVPF